MLQPHLAPVARAHHKAHPDGLSAARIELYLGALVPRVMDPGGWTAAARHAGAEPLMTGHARPYDESTLRRAADRLDHEGCSERIACHLRAQVQDLVVASGEPAIAYSDVFDQPYYTKKLAHAAPIGRLGNRILAATYFGVTTLKPANGPTLFLHLSWHKPASPLRDALEDLFADEARLAWWQTHVRLHILDRGANGNPVLSWLWAWEIPYLTIGHKSAQLWRFHAPTARSTLGLPLVIRPDARLGGTESEGPWELIVPAHLDDPEARRGIRFRSAVPITVEDLEDLNGLYKTRWPSMENALKALQSRGFGRNRTRSVVLTTRRGTDGELARQREKEASAQASLSSLLEQAATGANVKAVLKAAQTVTASRSAQEKTEQEASLKHARVQGGSEWLGKWLHLLTHNALALVLWSSDDESVRTMSPTLLFDLLLGRPALTCVQDQTLTMWVERSAIAEDRLRQQALTDLFNKQRLQSRGRLVRICLHETSARMAA